MVRLHDRIEKMGRLGIAGLLCLVLAALIADMMSGQRCVGLFVGWPAARTPCFGLREPRLIDAKPRHSDEVRAGHVPSPSSTTPDEDWTQAVRGVLEARRESALHGHDRPNDDARTDTERRNRADEVDWLGVPPEVIRKLPVAEGAPHERSNAIADQEMPSARPPRPNVQPRLIAAAQRRLASLGYDPGPVDGRLGRQTYAAIREFQRDSHLPDNGVINAALLARLEAVENVHVQLRQQELEAMDPAPKDASEPARARDLFGSLLGGFQRLLGKDFDSVKRPDEVRSYCRTNAATWIYDFGREAFVYCGNVIAEQGASAIQHASDR
ncbi:MAG: peptidoglycan-binding protein [Rhodospirillales bacterium]|nr:peptidoglycan-binding protein [Rhodospirillales bacterium]